jgi:hypothetical protein
LGPHRYPLAAETCGGAFLIVPAVAVYCTVVGMVNRTTLQVDAVALTISHGPLPFRSRSTSRVVTEKLRSRSTGLDDTDVESRV